jgi:hypothetical protein
VVVVRALYALGRLPLPGVGDSATAWYWSHEFRVSFWIIFLRFNRSRLQIWGRKTYQHL